MEAVKRQRNRERKRLEDATLLALKMEGGDMSQIPAASRSWKKTVIDSPLEPPDIMTSY